jgi:hypothetical protein
MLYSYTSSIYGISGLAVIFYVAISITNNDINDLMR